MLNKNLISIIFCSLLLTGCDSFGKKEKPRTPAPVSPVVVEKKREVKNLESSGLATGTVIDFTEHSKDRRTKTKDLSDTALFEHDFKNSREPVLVKASAQWCGPCKMMVPIFEKLATQYKDKVVFVEIDVDKHKIDGLDVQSIPAFVFIKDGEIKDMVVGSRTPAQLKAEIKKYFDI